MNIKNPLFFILSSLLLAGGPFISPAKLMARGSEGEERRMEEQHRSKYHGGASHNNRNEMNRHELNRGMEGKNLKPAEAEGAYQRGQESSQQGSNPVIVAPDDGTLQQNQQQIEENQQQMEQMLQQK